MPLNQEKSDNNNHTEAPKSANLRSAMFLGSCAILSAAANLTPSLDNEYEPLKLSSTEEVAYKTIFFIKDVVSPSWLTELYQIGEDAISAEDIQSAVSGITDLFISKDYSSVDTILAQLEVDKLSALSLVTIARSTFPARDNLQNWDRAITRISEQLEVLGKKPSKALRGLI